MALSKTKVSELYVAVFGRAAEGEGSDFWSGQDDTVSGVANLMFDQQVVKDYFNVTDFNSETNVRQVVETIYKNTLNKTQTDDPDGINFWVDFVVSKGNSMGEMIENLTAAARSTNNAGAAQDTFIHKVFVSEYTADTIYSFTDFSSFQGYIAGIDHTFSSLETASDSILTEYADLLASTKRRGSSSDLISELTNDVREKFQTQLDNLKNKGTYSFSDLADTAQGEPGSDSLEENRKAKLDAKNNPDVNDAAQDNTESASNTNARSITRAENTEEDTYSYGIDLSHDSNAAGIVITGLSEPDGFNDYLI